MLFSCGRSYWRWHLGPGVDWDVSLNPGHLRLGRERCGGRRVLLQEMTRQEHQRSVESVGAGAGSSARSYLVLRGGVFHLWSLRIPMHTQSAGLPRPATPPKPPDMSLHRRQRGFMKLASWPCTAAFRSWAIGRSSAGSAGQGEGTESLCSGGQGQGASKGRLRSAWPVVVCPWHRQEPLANHHAIIFF
jgi:hypothetical protein